MDCKEFEKLIPNFIEKKMNYPTLKRFAEHMDECPNCKEEMTIQYLVTEGISRLEDGNAFDLQKELRQRMTDMDKKLKFHGFFITTGTFVEAICICVIVGIVIWILL